LQRLDYRAAVPQIEALVERVRGIDELWHSPSSMVAIGWKVELAAAEALIALGAEEKGRALAAKYVDDARVPVREYARRL
jgi:hypothetical protein